MNRFFSMMTPVALTAGLVAVAVSGDAADAADLPLKAPPLAPADASPFWAEMDYLAWSVKGDRLPALVTTSPAGTPRPQAGALGAPGALFAAASAGGVLP